MVGGRGEWQWDDWEGRGDGHGLLQVCVPTHCCIEAVGEPEVACDRGHLTVLPPTTD